MIDQLEGREFAGEFLEHYGVKGMKWGVRKRDKNPVDVSVKTRPGKKVKTKGGENYTPSEDAIRAATLRRVAKKSTTDSLSNKELQEAIARMNLEQQYSRLASSDQSIGKKIAKLILGNAGDQELAFVGDTVVTKTKRESAGLAAKYGVKVAKSAVGAGKK